MEVYELIKTIGGGNFGQVYLAKHRLEGRDYVLKKVKTRDMSTRDRENTENEVNNRFINRIGSIVAKTETHKYCRIQRLVP